MVIDKPAGFTSHDVVSKVKRILGVKKAGHTGTLDPMATGVLPVCINEATKLAQFLSAENKTYLATMLLGVRTDTQDIEGKVTHESDQVVVEEEIRRTMRKMVGKISQTPPAFSALKHKGKPLYKYARHGEFPEVAPREVEIFSLDIREISFPRVIFEISCSKGTYIRTICADVGNMLGCGACLSGLRRRQSGFFTEALALTLEGHDADGMKKKLLDGMLPMGKCLPAFTAVEVSESQADKLRAGFQPDAVWTDSDVLPFLAAGDMIKFISPEGHLVAVGQSNGPVSGARTIRVFSKMNEQ